MSRSGTLPSRAGTRRPRWRLLSLSALVALGCAGANLASEKGGRGLPDCSPISGLEDLLQPGRVVLFGEQHGTVQSPAFVLQASCLAVRAGLRLTVGLELAAAEQDRVDRFLISEGNDSDRAELIAGAIWQRDYQDGRNSTAMAELIDGLRELKVAAPELEVVLFDAAWRGRREAEMAETLAAAARENAEGITLVLTGNLHSRMAPAARGAPMGSRLADSIGADRVLALDVAHLGGTSWLCFATSEGQECGTVKLRGRGPSGPAGVEWGESIGETGHHGWYRVGEITASPPAKSGFLRRSPASSPSL